MLFFLKILRTYQMNDPYLLNMWVANSWLITKCKLVSVINAFSEIFFLLSFFVYLWRLIFPLGIVTRSQAKNGALFERFAFFLFLFNEFYFLFTKFFFFKKMVTFRVPKTVSGGILMLFLIILWLQILRILGGRIVLIFL